MSTLKKTYRLFAALMLVLFVGTIVLPAGVAAASLHCDMEMHKGTHACCFTPDINCHQEQEKELQDCGQQVFCEQIIESKPSDITAVFQSTKMVITAELSKELTTIEEDSDPPPAIRDESPSLYQHPPIFLLNSTFLN